MSLRDYSKKRRFEKTSEPKPAAAQPIAKTEKPRLFVVQKHAASHLHYDLRLEMEGVLKSWAVPKGIPLDNETKRLAIQVEDHPLEYANFEGTIPKGEYGAGTVEIWDRGEYTVSGVNPVRALKEGKLHLCLKGKRLRGEWTLVRTRDADPKKPAWLLMKTGSSDGDTATGRAEVAFLEPMKPKLVAALPAGPGWLLELKFDGYRAIALKSGSSVSLLSRNQKPLNFPEIAEAVAALPCEVAIFDGEIVAVDEQGRPSFQLLQAREQGDPAPILYYLFDLVRLDGADLRNEPLTERKHRLAALLRDASGPLRFSSDLPGSPETVLEQIRGRGLEGVVAKRAASVYEPGRRSGAWVKVKCVNEADLVIGGYTPPGGSRKYFGSVLTGYYEGKQLRFAGKAGTGFDERMLATLHRRFQEMRIPQCPFVDLPSKSAGRWAQGITPAQMKQCAWVRPELVCRVKFTEWTRDGKLRHPVFLGLREDIPASSVKREEPAG